MSKNTQFIRTKNKHTSEILCDRQYTLIDFDGEYWTFLNNGSLEFDDAGLSDISYSDILCG